MHPPPRQRALLVLRDVLGFRAAQAAELLGSGGVSVNSALSARVRRRTAGVPRRTGTVRHCRARRANVRSSGGSWAHWRTSTSTGSSLLAEDAWPAMPPEPLECQGHTAIARFYRAVHWWGGRALRLVPTGANHRSAFGSCPREPGSAVAHGYGLVVLTLRDDRISAITRFGDNGLLPRFGPPRTLRDWIPSVQESTDVTLTCTDLCSPGPTTASMRREGRLVRCAPTASRRAPRPDTGRLMLAHELVAEG